MMAAPPDEAEAPRSAHPIRDAVADLQDRIAAAFGIEAGHRAATITQMLERSGRGAAGYWLQLLLAMGIATLGLVLGSAAVVIGAMLISPLMGPIVELGMGLAIGSPFLVIRSFVRTASSVAVVVTSAGLITLTLPFNEITPEIAARTSPTALDLLIATLCAIAAAYTTVRPGSDTTATAAGTAIGIALVPPLCVVGYGLGAEAPRVASGAALLFTANFCAIVLFAVICFLLLGFPQVSTGALEHAELERSPKGAIRRAAAALRFVFGMRYGPLLRVLMPLALLGAVYVPLREALAEVTWEVRVRASIQQMLDAMPRSAVRSSLTVDRESISVRLVTVGRAEDAAKLERELKEKITAAAGRAPTVDVIAVPDAAALQEMAATLKPAASPVPATPEPPDVDLLRAQLATSLARAWPEEAGALLAWRLELPERAAPAVEVVHLGPALGVPGAAMLAEVLARDALAGLVVRDAALPVEPLVASPEEGVAWLVEALGALGWLERVEALHGCVQVPEPPARPRQPVPGAEAVERALRASAPFRTGRLHIDRGPRWSASITAAPCAGMAPEPEPASPASSAPRAP